MLNFKTYKEAEEYHKNNYPIQTRNVLVEKYSKQIITRQYDKFSKEIMHKPALPIHEQEIILKNRKEYLSKILFRFNSHYGVDSLMNQQYGDCFNIPSSEYIMEEYIKNKHLKKDDLNSMWLDICELF